MPIELTLNSKVVLSNVWMDKECWEADYKFNIAALIELLEEDYYQALEDIGGFRGLIKSAEWKE